MLKVYSYEALSFASETVEFGKSPNDVKYLRIECYCEKKLWSKDYCAMRKIKHKLLIPYIIVFL